jgi:hypothetical protein
VWLQAAVRRRLAVGALLWAQYAAVWLQAAARRRLARNRAAAEKTRETLMERLRVVNISGSTPAQKSVPTKERTAPTPLLAALATPAHVQRGTKAAASLMAAHGVASLNTRHGQNAKQAAKTRPASSTRSRSIVKRIENHLTINSTSKKVVRVESAREEATPTAQGETKPNHEQGNAKWDATWEEEDRDDGVSAPPPALAVCQRYISASAPDSWEDLL